MSTYLAAYHASKTSKPVSRKLNRLLSRPLFATAIGLGTLVLECVLIPMTLLCPPLLRSLMGTYGMVALHIGIAMGMSLRVGLVFLTTLPVLSSSHPKPIRGR